jgi:hypothetical protein
LHTDGFEVDRIASRLVDDATLVPVVVRFAGDPIRQRGPHGLLRAINREREGITLVTDEVVGDVRDCFVLIAARDEQRGAEDFRGAGSAPAVGIVGRVAGLR